MSWQRRHQHDFRTVSVRYMARPVLMSGPAVSTHLLRGCTEPRCRSVQVLTLAGDWDMSEIERAERLGQVIAAGDGTLSGVAALAGQEDSG